MDISALARSINPRLYSGSVAELGPNAGPLTWEAASRDALPLFGDQFNREAFNAFFAGFGAWDDAELAALTDEQCAGLMLQFISADLRECEFSDWPPVFSDSWWQCYESAARDGVVSSRFFRASDGSIHYELTD